MRATSVDRRKFGVQVAAGAAAACWFPIGMFAADESNLIRPATRQAIQRGLDFLASRQQADGCFGVRGYARNVAVCALGGMAMLSEGSTPGRGRYGRNVQRCVDYLLAKATPGGLISDPESVSHGPMYGHGFATLFLAETHGMIARDELRQRLQMATRIILASQNAEGGWRYEAQRKDADISVTICQIMALRAAKNAGIYVPNDAIDRCMAYVRKMQNEDGGFSYTEAGTDSQFPRSAAGVVAFYSAGIYQGPEIEKGLRYLMQYLPTQVEPENEPHFFYGQYYAAQAMWHAGQPYWRKWYQAIHDTLLEQQNENGSWSDKICDEYGTAMACLVLQMPASYLPIFQR